MQRSSRDLRSHIAHVHLLARLSAVTWECAVPDCAWNGLSVPLRTTLACCAMHNLRVYMSPVGKYLLGCALFNNLRTIFEEDLPHVPFRRASTNTRGVLDVSCRVGPNKGDTCRVCAFGSSMREKSRRSNLVLQCQLLNSTTNEDLSVNRIVDMERCCRCCCY